MDIAVADVDGLPDHTYISVRYGEARRLAHFRAGEVLSFPTEGLAEELPKAFTVDVFRKVGTKQVSLAGITALAGTMKHEGLVIPSLEIQGSPITVSLFATLGEAKRPVSAPDSKKQLVAAKAKKYLEKHGLQSVLHEMFAQLLEKCPGDPLAFMVDFMEQQREVVEDKDVLPRIFSTEPGLGDEPLPGFAADGSAENFPDLTHHHSVVADILRQNTHLYNDLRCQGTSLGVTLAQCIKPGIDCPGHALVKVAGAFAGDQGSYDVFREVFNPLICALHPGFVVDGRHNHPEDGNPAKLTSTRIDETGKYAVFASMDTRRNVRGLRLPTCCSQVERREVERMLTRALATSVAELNGTYFPLRSSQSHAPKLGGMTSRQEERLRCAGMLFNEPDSRMRLSAGLGRQWPDARGVFVSDTQGLYMWCNEEDHLRLFAKQHEVDLRKLWERLATMLGALENCVKRQHGDQGFIRSKRFGFVTTCPSRLGTALRVCVSLKIPLLAGAVDLLALCRFLDMESNQMESTAHGRIWNVTSGDCLGISEVDLINGMIEGCHILVDFEQRLERGETINDALTDLGIEPAAVFASARD